MHAVLMSIKPEFVARIRAGEKRVEFRRRGSSALAGAVGLVYESQPTCAVVMRVRFGAAVQGTPRELWRAYRGVAGIDRGRFDAYMAGCGRAWGLEIDGVEILETARDLAWMRARGVTPPVSYALVAPGATWARGLLRGSRERAA